ncbi:MAG TPA: histidine kinase [Cyanobacteria bacterium UBA11149]|nr:histidine kinase [Cyanobacteria bacterium UBA11367]HBE56720.1 histidine kinase [Cyanobacteria bacterium UBA11366]HBK63037.1 histidine kinase [Cyanobacteria bacterium UBA11166]HBR75302.1 histidine kinase [Cyanobacteria bacterium UBA11159]HBS71409.1 histidine kinase [Cyanobacteria bacterium UBA11153]HBW89953.1 histidine kinase [Cyanobacteria bacterium UBA11149]HCA98179.1 histidine kinase [Cyanobacteria bacterium UBA9226]
MLKKLKLAHKFTLFLSLVFIASIIIGGIILSQVSYHQAEGQVAYNAELLMKMMNSVKSYTNTEVRPLLDPLVNKQPKFIPQTIATYSARKIFESISNQSEYQDYLYKDAVLNPTNPEDKANELETELINQFNQEFSEDPNNIQDKYDFTTTETGESFYVARPIIITDQTCLKCHGKPEAAPKSIIASYGKENGFGWELNKPIGVQIIYVPSEQIFQKGRDLSSLTIGIFIVMFTIAIILINLLIKGIVIDKIRPMSRLAQKIRNDELSPDPMTEPDIQKLEKVAKNGDELGHLARIFEQMANAIYERKQKFAEQIEELTLKSQESNRASDKMGKIAYFKSLQKKAKSIRDKVDDSDKTK